MGRTTRRGPWLPDEDNTLIQLVHLQGPNNWVRISQHMQHRSPKQCRERYHQNLKPSLNHEPISADEGDLIEQLVHDMGKRWAEIARRLGNRSDNAVKNWWNGSMNRRKRTSIHQAASARGVGLRTDPISATAPSRTLSVYTELPRGYSARASPVNATTGSLTMVDRNQKAEPVHVTLPDVRSLPTLNQPYSAQVLSRSSPECFTVHGYHTPQSSRDFRLAPIDWPTRMHNERSGYSASGETNAISPAATECSTLQAPSLVSDNFSRCSVSPKTISSPRPGLPAPIETSRAFYGHARRTSHMSITSDGKMYPSDEGYVSALPTATSFDPSVRRFPFDMPSKALPTPPIDRRPDLFLPPPKLMNMSERDSRMNVARLLE
jgi:Myb-like DNA-binding protein FlbD